MCTVTFLPVKDKFFITTNRDEKDSRKHALPPATYFHKGSKLLFPKDADAGGSWIALHANGNAAVLLNGAFEKHVHQPPYSKSRGIVLLDVIAEERPVRYFTKLALQDVEPFTLVIWENNCLYECRWDGKQKHCLQLPTYRHYIWSSATLYDQATAKKREYWLARFLNKTPVPSMHDILHFHKTAGDGDDTNDLRMTRQGVYSTVSITSILLNDMTGSMVYHDCRNETTHQGEINFYSSYVVSQNFIHENN